jgi:methylthioribose-1-phosphate isomerase
MIDTVRWLDSKHNILSSIPENTESLLPGKLRIIDQTLLPGKLEYITTDKPEEIFQCIKRLSVRGAPAIGCAAALGLAAVSGKSNTLVKKTFLNELCKTSEYLASSRPTAVNLSWALKRCITKIENSKETRLKELKKILTVEALSILQEDISMCLKIGKNGLALLKNGDGILTHCNAGALATGDFGTALSPLYAAHKKGFKITVYSDETRPLLQGARLTAWELRKAGIKVISICDNMAGQVMREGKINIVIVGADRIAANGDTANKIGTYSLAILAKYHKIPFYVAAPYSTIDISIPDGQRIPIEQRSPNEIAVFNRKRILPKSVEVYNPAFDVSPTGLISGIITEKVILKPPYARSIKEFMRKTASIASS